MKSARRLRHRIEQRRGARGNAISPQVVLDLVERFAHNLDYYHRPDYNETQVRHEFIDPPFMALGWDVDNRRGVEPR